MLFTAEKNAGSNGGGSIDDLVRQIAKLVRHPSYRRGGVVSALLLRHLPLDGGYAWQGETALRERLSRAQLDATTIDHLVDSTRSEIIRLRGPRDF